MALDFVAGCIGGCAGVVVGHPLDTIKVKIQTQDCKNPIYKGTWDCFRSILKTESVKGLFRGVTSPLGGVALVNAVVFGVYGNVQRQLGSSDNLLSHFVAGGAAGFLQSFICSPMELAKTRLQVQKSNQYKGTFDCLMKVSKVEGIRGFYKGLGITMGREIPAFAFYFYTYELFAGGSNSTTAMMLFAGGMAGTVSWIICYPMDVLKSRVQSDGVNGMQKYNGVLDCLKKSLKHEGPTFLTRGLNSTIIRAFPTNAVTFAVVGWIFKLAGVPQSEEVPAGPQKVEKEQKMSTCFRLKDNHSAGVALYEEGCTCL